MQKTADPKVVGNRLRALRGCRTRTGTAREIGISYSMLTKCEYGLRIPGEDIRKKIADYYGVSVKSIFYAQE